jgi:hypothetical protein
MQSHNHGCNQNTEDNFFRTSGRVSYVIDATLPNTRTDITSVVRSTLLSESRCAQIKGAGSQLKEP